MKYILKSRLWTFFTVAVLFVLVGAISGELPSAPEAFTILAAAPFLMLGETSMETLSELIGKQGTAFNEFKNANDARLKAIEDKGYAPADLTAKVDTINTELTQLGKDIAEVAKKANRPAATDAETLTADQVQHKAAITTLIRTGNKTPLLALEQKVLQQGSDVDGGFLIHSEMDQTIERVASVMSTVRQLAEVRTIGKTSIEFRVKTSGTAARWVGEGDAGGETTNAKYAKMEIFAREMEIEPWAFNSALEDMDFDIESDLADEAGIGFGEAEGLAFVSGNGIEKPRGFLDQTIVANASYAWGSVGYVASAAAGAFAASNPADNIINLLHSLKAGYRNGAVLLMNDVTLSLVRQIKDASGAFYLFNPDATGEFGGFVLGKPVAVDDNMPAIAANSYSIAYANWKRAYRIVDRRGIVLIRDNLTAKGTTKFNFRKRVGGGIKNYEAIKLMKFAAS